MTENTAFQKYPNFKEYLWFKKHEPVLMQRYFGRYVVVKDEKIIGDYGSRKLARQQTIQNHKPGTFIIHLCTTADTRRVPRVRGRQIVVIDGK